MTKPLIVQIAKLKGWTDIAPSRAAAAPSPYVGNNPQGERVYVPRWSEDLNLMRELEGELSDYEWVQYITLLQANLRDGDAIEELKILVNAEAAQKAKACVRVKGGSNE